jgi:integrase
VRCAGFEEDEVGAGWREIQFQFAEQPEPLVALLSHLPRDAGYVAGILQTTKYKVDPQELSTLIDSVKPYIQDFLCVLYLTGFRMGDLFDLKREHLHEGFIRVVESKNEVEHYKEYSKWLSYYLDRALAHATIAGEKYNEGEVSEHVFTNRYGRPLIYDGLRAAMRIAGNEIPLRQIRALAESHKPGTLGHLGQMRKIYTRTVRTSPVK